MIDLSEDVGKAILKLTDADYNEQGLQDLLAAHGSAYDINLRVFRHLQSTITGGRVVNRSTRNRLAIGPDTEMTSTRNV